VVAEATTLTAGLVIEHWLVAVELMAIDKAGLEGVTPKLQAPVAMGPFPLVEAPTVGGAVVASVVVTGWAQAVLPAQIDPDTTP
jgi:hypothetical protein